MPKGSAVSDVESKLKSEYGDNANAVYGTLNKIGLMHGNKPTAKGLKPAKKKRDMNSAMAVTMRGHRTYRMPK